MEIYGVIYGGKVSAGIKSFSERSVTFRINGNVSSLFRVNVGLKQECIMSARTVVQYLHGRSGPMQVKGFEMIDRYQREWFLKDLVLQEIR